VRARLQYLSSEGTWAEGCYATDLGTDVGGTCTQDSDCLGGLCLTEAPSGDPIEDGYCSAPCVDNSECPSDSVCIAQSGYREGQGFCALACNDTGNGPECPPERPETFYISCVFKGQADGSGAIRVCFQS